MFGGNENQVPQVFSSFHSQPSTSTEISQIQNLLLSSSYTRTGASIIEEDRDVGKGSGKKDRHSKIYTSQGPRDRRVRLSIGIARKFFDLQEMLGFDKPSKALDWLLKKSKNAINDLVQKREKGDPLDEGKAQEGCSASRKKNGRGVKDLQMVDLAKESRLKARARARERTREKMQMRSSQEFNILMQYMNGFTEFEQLNQDMIQESIVIKRKVKHNHSVFGFHQNVVISRDFTSNCPIPTQYTSGENWDISASQSNLYTVFDQYKFNNS